MDDMVAEIWRTNRPAILERLAGLASAIEALAGGRLGAADRTVALEHAHRLHGSLGTFGFPSGSDLAERAEAMLCDDGGAASTAGELAASLRALHAALDAG